MSFIGDHLEKGETVRYKARVRWAAYGMPIVWLVLVMAIGGVSGLASTELFLTDRRVLARVGLFRRQQIAVPYSHIEVVKLRQSALGRLFDYGTLVITSKNGGRIVLKGIAEPVDVQLQIEEAAELAVLGRKLSQVVMEKW